MKVLIVVALLVLTAYLGHGYLNASKSFGSNPYAGIVLFTSEVCHQPCADARAVLRETGVSVDEVVVSRDDAASMARFRSKGGSEVVPLLVTKNGSYESFHRVKYLSAIADSEGLQVLPEEARKVLSSHFDNGEAKWVMYATKWCPYCAKARAYFSNRGIHYEERDVEASDEYGEFYQWLNSSGYPLIYFGAKRLQGFDRHKLDRLLSD